MLKQLLTKFSRHPLLAGHGALQRRVETPFFSYILSNTNNFCTTPVLLMKDAKKYSFIHLFSHSHANYASSTTRSYSSVRERRIMEQVLQKRNERMASSENKDSGFSQSASEYSDHFSFSPKSEAAPLSALDWKSVPQTVQGAQEQGKEDMQKIFWVSGQIKAGLFLFKTIVAIGVAYVIFNFVRSNFSIFPEFGGGKDAASRNAGLFPLMFSKQTEFVTDVDINFSDVKGCDEAKEELKLVVDFLRHPKRFSRLGARLPKGILLEGPPGVGKTLLAKAVAGEAQVTYLHAVGSEFDEVFVGVGASRIRNLFSEARRHAPCVIFIDEFDAVGSRRSSSQHAPYANQTINQLLAEMDGFKPTEGIIVLGATNRKNQLDKAVLRPGRFDLHINVSPPDLAGRTELFELYLGKVKADLTSIRKEVLAAATTGFTGADIQNMVNQAAIQAALKGSEHISMDDLWHARDKILMGASKKRIPDASVNETTAYHEAGHALVSLYSPGSIPLHKVTIIPRGHAVGMTSFVPEKDTYLQSKEEMLSQLVMAMGGRVAEELIFGSDNVTNGASSDFQNATNIAKNMVKYYGMSEKLGPRSFAHTSNKSSAAVGPSTKAIIDEEVKRFLDESYERAKQILTEHRNELKLLAEALLKYETLNKEDVLLVIKGEKPKHAIELSIKLDDPKLNPHTS